MHHFFLINILLLVGYVIYSEGAKDYSKFDSVDVDSILKSERLTDNYLKCFLDKGRCTPEAGDMKELISDALESDCKQCSEKQQEIGKKVIRYLIKNKRAMWDELQDKYDPNHKYVEKYKDQLKKEGIEI